MKNILLLFWTIIFFLPDPACSTETIRLAAAASMTDAIRKMADDFSASHPNCRLVTNFASSGTLAQQIAHGAPVDIYISANPKWLRHLIEKGKIVEADARTLTANSLVFISGSATAYSSLPELSTIDRLAIATPTSAPAGYYARQAMRESGIYDDLLAAHKIIFAKDVRQALIYADRRAVDGAFVYGSDARLARRATVRFTVDTSLHEPIRYPIALTLSGRQKKGAVAFVAFALGKQGQQILANFGFSAP